MRSFTAAPDTRGVRVRTLAASSLLLVMTSCRFGAPAGSTAQGRDIGNLYHLFFFVAIGVGAVVYGLILWAAVRYRRRRHDDDSLPPQFRHHPTLEIVYTVIPVLIVIGLFVVTFRTEDRVDHVSPRPAVVVDVLGFQWQWRFDYPGHGVSVIGGPGSPPTLMLPVGQVVQINLATEDVIHSFFVPDFLFKRDAVPGIHNRFDWTVPRAGTFRGECAEFCGLDHDAMTFYVKAVSPAEFQQWLASQGASG